MTGLNLAKLKSKVVGKEMDFDYLAKMEDVVEVVECDMEEEFIVADEAVKPEAPDLLDVPEHKKIFNQEFKANDIIKKWDKLTVLPTDNKNGKCDKLSFLPRTQISPLVGG